MKPLTSNNSNSGVYKYSVMTLMINDKKKTNKHKEKSTTGLSCSLHHVRTSSCISCCASRIDAIISSSSVCASVVVSAGAAASGVENVGGVGVAAGASDGV